MKAHLKKHAGTYGIAIAIATSVTSTILQHFFPAEDDTARAKVVQSHNVVKDTMDENNTLITSEIMRLEKRINEERIMRRELETSVRALEDETRYFHGAPEHHASVARRRTREETGAEDSERTVISSPLSEDGNGAASTIENISNKMHTIPQLEGF